MSGYCATGIASSDEQAGDRGDDGDDDGEPRPVDEDGGEHRLSSGSAGGGTGVRRTGAPGRTRLQALDDDLLAAGQALLDDDVGAALGAELDALDDRLAVLDDEDIDALLVGDQRRLRHHDLLLRRAALDGDAHQLAVDQRAVGIGHRRAHQHGIGRPVDR